MNLKKILSVAIAVLMVMSLAVNAFAADEDVTVSTSGGTGETVVALTADAAIFSVTVPTQISFHIKADGTVTAPTDVKLINNSAAAVKVTKIDVQEDAWKLASFATDMAKEPVNAKKLALQLTAGEDTVATTKDGDQTLAHNAAAWTMEAKGHEGATLQLTCAANASAVSNGFETAVNAASIVFTIGWDIPNK